jgi:predicted DNA-binding transcriptional regulator AlpA
MDIPVIFSCKELQTILGISRSQAYVLMRQADFPTVEISPRKRRIYRDDFLEWIENRTNNK